MFINREHDIHNLCKQYSADNCKLYFDLLKEKRRKKADI